MKWQPRVEYTFCAHGPYEINLAPEGLYAPDGTVYRWAPGRLKVYGPDGTVLDLIDEYADIDPTHQ